MIPRLDGSAVTPEIDWIRFLQRPRLPSPAPDALKPLREASILVTGAGGSIGSALSLRLAALNPRGLTLLDASEHALFLIKSQLENRPAKANAAFVLGDCGDASLLEEVFAAHRPTLIFHAAAYKHVPLLEEQPLAAIANNALATRALADCVRRNASAKLVLLSTDKAVAPASILGASKRIAELLVLEAGGAVVRLANVLGTAGSVVETFLRQIAAGGPITITSRDAERYFLTCDEAVDLLLSSSVGAAAASLMVPRLDGSSSIAGLARFLVATRAPNRNIDFRFTGLRPGDKTRESLWSEDECPVLPCSGDSVQLEYAAIDAALLSRRLRRLDSAVQRRDLAQALDIVREIVPDYSPSETVLSLAGQTHGAIRS